MSDLSSAIKQICEEKGLDQTSVITTIESALAAAYRKDFGEKNQNIKVEFDPETGKSKIFDVKTVVEDVPEEELDENEEPVQSEIEGKSAKEEKPVLNKAEGKKKESKAKNKTKKPITSKTEESEAKVPSLASDGTEEEERKFNPKTDLQISDAKKIKKTAKVGDEIKTKLEIPDEYGRMAAQTAKQVIVQRLREAEREMIFSEFKDKEKEVVSGVIQRREGRMVLVDLGKTVGCLPPEEQIYGENYNTGERVKVYIKEVRFGPKGSEVILSRTSDEILKKVFYLEIPEISNGLVELKSVAREAGSRSKVAVWTDSNNVDPIGSCVGQRGARIQTIISELGGEKIDIIQYDEDPAKFIAHALSPAKVISIETKDAEKKAIVKVQADQLSLAIGKSGQNVRLAARLTGWKIDIIEAQDKKVEDKKTEKEDKTAEVKEEKETKKKKEPPSTSSGQAKEKKSSKKSEKKTDDEKPEAKKVATDKTEKKKDKNKKDDKTDEPKANKITKKKEGETKANKKESKDLSSKSPTKG